MNLSPQVEAGMLEEYRSGKVRAVRPTCARFQTVDMARLGGFTLVEMMVVIALIGILTAMIIPEMRGTMEEARLRATSRELINVFHLAYSRAVSLNQIHRVRLDEQTGHYRIEKGARDPGLEDTFVPLNDIPGCQGELDRLIAIKWLRPSEEPEGEQVAEPGPSRRLDLPEWTVAFYPDGTADRTDIRLEDRTGSRLFLRVNPTTARVQVLEKAPEQASPNALSSPEASP
jgi:type II secretion system protein H